MFKSIFKPAVSIVQKKTISILHANDHKIYRDGISTMLKKYAPHIKLKGEAEDFHGVLSTLIKIHADILLLDNIMPGGDIMQVLPLIKKECPELKIIILTMYTAPSTYLKDMMQWTEGCLNFTANEDDIIRCIETVYCGGYYFHLYGYDNKLTEDD